jgi:indolepyruvate ferredoxin oxidoreductase beta subunit
MKMEKSVKNILMVGVGGQGIIVASDILTNAALIAGYDAKKSEIHGMSQRGGSVFSHIRFGPKVYSPVISRGQAHILVSLELMETLRWIDYANSASLIISTHTTITPTSVTQYPTGIEQELIKICKNLTIIDIERLVKMIGNPKFLNVAILGILAGQLEFAEKHWRKAIEQRVPARFFEQNWHAFNKGKLL